LRLSLGEKTMFFPPDNQVLVVAVKLGKENLNVQRCGLGRFKQLKVLETGVEQGNDSKGEADGFHD